MLNLLDLCHLDSTGHIEWLHILGHLRKLSVEIAFFVTVDIRECHN